MTIAKAIARKSSILLTIAIAATAVGSPVVLADGGKNPANWSEAYEPFHLAGPIYYVGTHGLGVYLIKSSAGLVLVSGATPDAAGMIVESIRKLGFDPKQVRLLLAAHAHFDHAGTTAELKRVTGGEVVAMKGDAELLASGGKTDYLFAERPRFHFAGVKADRLVKDGEAVTLGDVSLVAHATPGHTPGCTTWEMRYEEGGKTVDVVFADGASINPGTRLAAAPSYEGIAGDYRRTFATLEGLRPDVFLSYHTEIFGLDGKRERQRTAGEKVWVDPEGYAAFVKKKKAEFEGLVAMQAKGQ